MREEEARDKWCPFGRRYIFDEFTTGGAMTAINEPDSIDYRQNCIASDCMMWRWEISPSEAARVNAMGHYSAVEIGYCGLAGKE